MHFQFTGLDATPFASLFDLTEAELAARHIVKMTADSQPGYPCRISLKEAPMGRDVLLLNHSHLEVASPYASRHAIFVADGSEPAHLEPDAIPDVVTNRLVSLRAFDGADHIVDADVCDGDTARVVLEHFFANPAICYVDVHAAKRGCFLARAKQV